MKRPARRSLRKFLILWSGAIGLAFLLMAIDAGVAFYRLDGVAQDELHDAMRLQHLHEFEVAALEANRNPQKINWQRADCALTLLQNEEQQQPQALSAVVHSYSQLKEGYDPKAPWSDESTFLDGSRALRSGELQGIKSDTAQSEQLDHWSRLVLSVLSGVALMGIISGGSVLWTRVFQPTLAIANAARRFENGDLTARVVVESDDELGELGQTFNDMAKAVEAREHERLRFVAALAHDLKNPLVVIGGASAMMRDKPHKFSPEEQVEWLGKIARNARTMEAMIFDLTDAVQAQTSSLHLNKEVCDIAFVLRECVSETSIAFPHHKIVFDGPPTLELCVDEARLERVVANLLSNAAKYSVAGTTVTAHLEKRDKEVVIEVKDEGAGIAPGDLKRLFTPFVRLTNTSKMASGTGLGLSTVKKIVEAHGGAMEVESELGEGSTFRVLLPIQS